MLKKTQISSISKLLKIDQAKLEAALASEKEEDIEISEDLNVLTKDELSKRDKNTYDTAKKAGEEMLIKELKKKHSIDMSGEDPEKFVEALNKKIREEVEKNPDARVAEANKLLEEHKKALKKANDKLEAVEAERDQVKLDTKLLSVFPQERLDTMNNEEYLSLLKSKIRIVNKDGKEVVERDGQIVVNEKTMEPVAVADAVKGYFTERKWIKEAGTNGNEPMKGRGAGSSNVFNKQGKFTKMSEINAYAAANGINMQGEKGSALLQAAIKENPDGIDMNS